MIPRGGFQASLFRYLRGEAEQELVIEEADIEDNESYSVAGLLSASQVGEEKISEDNKKEERSFLVIVQGNTLAPNFNPVTFITQEPRDEVITYVVEKGDVPSTIAAAFGISTNTLLWANKLRDGDLIRPGDKLIILPITGVQHKVKEGETLGAIAKKYKADTNKIIAFNILPADGTIKPGQDLIIPDGVTSLPPKPRKTYASAYVASSSGKSRRFPWGQCTWYVAQKRYVPWSGHAKSWLHNARAMGFSTGTVPQKGAIMVMRGGGRYGHVAYVEAVKGNWITISEMNHVGVGIKSVRVLNKDSGLIRGYIY